MLRTSEFGTATGSVTEFDKHVGLGTITSDNGAAYPFHCTALTDGSRDIAVGTKVSFTIVAGHHGRYEATQINV